MTNNLLLQLHRQLINLRRQNEVVLGQPADGVCPDFNGQVTVTGQMEIRMVSFLLGQTADAVEKVKPGEEVLAPPLPANALAVRRELPVPHVCEIALYLIG